MFKVLVINEADKLSRGAQDALRRTMERYMSQCRIIMVCESLCKILPPIQSRCQLIRIPLPDPPSLTAMLKRVVIAEKSAASAEMINKAITLGKRNIRMVLLILQSLCWYGDGGNKPDCYTSPLLKGQRSDWEVVLDDVAELMVLKQTTNAMKCSIDKIHELLAHGVPADLVLKCLTKSLHQRLTGNENCRLALAELAAKIDATLTAGSKPSLHLEAFVHSFALLCFQSIHKSK